MADDALPPLADAAVLARRVNRPADDPDVVSAIGRASARFREAVGHAVSAGEHTVALDGGGLRRLPLPAPRVSAVTSCIVNGTEVEVDVSPRSGMIARRDGRLFPDGYGNVTVTYTVPDEPLPGVADAVLEAAERIFRERVGVGSYQVGGITITAQSAAAGVTEAWTTAVQRHRIEAGDRA